MKTITIILSICFILSYPINIYSQINNDDITKQSSENFKKSFEKALNTMIKKAKLETKTSGENCKVEDLISKIDFSKHLLDDRRSLSMHFIYSLVANRNISRLPLDKFDKGNFKTINDRALNALSTTSDFAGFVYALTGKDIGAFEGSMEPPKNPMEDHSELGQLKWHYSTYQDIFSGSGSLPVDEINYYSKDCNVRLNSKLLVKKLDFPNIEYTLKTEVNIKCYCDDNSSSTEIKSGVLDYVATISGIFTSSKISFNEVKQPKVTKRSLECCPEKKEKKEEPTKTALNDDEGIQDLMPNQTIGFGAGAGFSQDFDETSFCVTAEYLYQINSNEDKGLYAGAEASHQITSFGEFESNKTMVGGKIQYNFSGTPSGETQFIAGLMANYAFGSNDNNGFTDDYTGTVFCAYGGANIRVSEDWSIGFQFPFLIFENFAFEPEFGEGFKTDATSLFINKNNPLKIIIRKRL